MIRKLVYFEDFRRQLQTASGAGTHRALAKGQALSGEIYPDFLEPEVSGESASAGM
jgi:hypothetical protein